MPSTATIDATPIAIPSADSAARARRVRRPSEPVRRTSAAVMSTSSPSRISTRRGNASAIARSCVIVTIVDPAACSSCSSARMSAPVRESRLPVGSSANRIAGRPTSARAIATRWRSPPDSFDGECVSRCDEPDRDSSASRARAPPLPLPRARVEQPGRDVVERAHPVEQEELLEDEPDRARPQRRQRALAELRRVLPGHVHLAVGRPLQRPHHVQQRRLPRPRRADDRARLARAHGQGHAAQRLDAARVRLAHVDEIEDRRRRARATSVIAPSPPCRPRAGRRPRPRPGRRRRGPAATLTIPRPTTSTAYPPPWRASSALTGTASASWRRSTAKPTSTGAWSRLSALPGSVIVTVIVDAVLATWSRPCRRRRCGRSTVRPDGRSTVTRSPTCASRCREASMSTRHDPVLGGDLPQRLAGPDLVADRGLRLAHPDRPVAEHDRAARELAGVVEVAVALELLDRVGRLPGPVAVDVTRVIARARAGCVRAGGRRRRRSSRARSRATRAACRRTGTPPARRRRSTASGRA